MYVRVHVRRPLLGGNCGRRLWEHVFLCTNSCGPNGIDADAGPRTDTRVRANVVKPMRSTRSTERRVCNSAERTNANVSGQFKLLWVVCGFEQQPRRNIRTVHHVLRHRATTIFADARRGDDDHKHQHVHAPVRLCGCLRRCGRRPRVRVRSAGTVGVRQHVRVDKIVRYVRHLRRTRHERQRVLRGARERLHRHVWRDRERYGVWMRERRSNRMR